MATARRVPKPRPVGDRSIPALDNICQNWHLSTATKCLSGVIKPDGKAEEWPTALVHSLSELSNITRGDHAAVEREFRQVREARMRNTTNTDPNLLVRDIKTIHKRRDIANRQQHADPTGTENGPSRQVIDRPTAIPRPTRTRSVFVDPEGEEYEEAGELSDEVPGFKLRSLRRIKRKPGRESSPITRPKGKGKKPVIGPSTKVQPGTRNILQIEPTRNEPSYDDAFEYEVKDVVPVPTGLTPHQRLAVLRKRKEVEIADVDYYQTLRRLRKKRSDLENTYHEITILEYTTELRE